MSREKIPRARACRREYSIWYCTAGLMQTNQLKLYVNYFYLVQSIMGATENLNDWFSNMIL